MENSRLLDIANGKFTPTALTKPRPEFHWWPYVSEEKIQQLKQAWGLNIDKYRRWEARVGTYGYIGVVISRDNLDTTIPVQGHVFYHDSGAFSEIMYTLSGWVDDLWAYIKNYYPGAMCPYHEVIFIRAVQVTSQGCPL